MADIGTAYVRIAPNMSGIQGKIASGFRGSGSQFAKQFGGEISGKSAVIIGAIAGVAQAAVSKAMNMITSSIGDAVSRVDTLNNAPKVLKNLGLEAEASQKVISQLSDGIEGLPTRLDDAASALTAIASASGLGLDEAKELTLAFNNMALAGGKGPGEAQRALTQFTQALGKGKFEMQDFKTLTEVMPAQMSQVAKSLLGPEANAQLLQQALSKGEVTLDDFNNAVVSLDKKGGAGFASFQDQAKDTTAGIGTAFTNMRTRITKGLAEIINAVGSEKIAEAVGTIGDSFRDFLILIADNLPPVIQKIEGFVDFIVRNKDIFAPLAVGIGAVLAAMKLWQIATTVATAVQGAFNLVLAANPISLIILAVIGLVAALTYFFTRTETGKAIIKSFGKVISAVWEGIKTGLQAVGSFFASVFARVKDIIGGAVNFIKSKFSAGFNFIRGLWGRLTGFFSNIFTNIKNAFTGIPGVGKDIVQGLWNGISGMGNWLKNKIIGFVKDKIPGPVKKALGISSPSKVFAEFGRNVDEGFAQGIDKHAGKVESAVNSMANTAISGMVAPGINPSVAFNPSPALGGAGGGVTNQTVTIQTVALGDAGAVREFFKQLNQDTINVGMGLTPIQGAN